MCCKRTHYVYIILSTTIEIDMDYLKQQHIDSLQNALDGCYRDLDYYESIGHQSRIAEVEAVIASMKKQINDAS